MFGDIVKPFLEILKQSLTYAIGLGAVAGLALFLPAPIMSALGLLDLRNEGKLYLGVSLLLCCAIIVAKSIEAGWGKYNSHRFLNTRKKRLHRLTAQEKQVLQGYIKGETRSQYLDIRSGAVSGLAAESIIYRSSEINNPMFGLTAFAHNIQPWAWEYLNEHRDLLSP